MPALQISQIAMDQPRRGLRSARAEIALLQQDDAQAAASGVARNADAVQSAANDREIVVRHTQGYCRELSFTTLGHDGQKRMSLL